MNKLLPVIFAILVLTGTSGMQYSMAQAPDLSKPEFYKPDTLVVKFKPGVSAEQQNAILSAQNSSVIDDLKLLKIKIISVPEPSLDAVQTALSNNPNVEFAEYAEGARPSLVPNDTRYLQNHQWYLDTINAEGAWDITKGGDFPIVILDSGIDMDHPDLASKIIHPYDAENLSNPNINDLSNCGHGTGVAGNAAADTDNGIGIAQIGWDTKIIPVKITQDSDPDCLGWSDAVLRGVEHGVSHGAKVVNLSYGFSGGSYHIQQAADLLRQNNGWLVISAGNSGKFSDKTDYPYIIFVSSTDSSDNRSGFSSFGNYVDISSPGSSILLTTNGGGYNYWQGTSMAAPLAAATLNLLYTIDPTLTSDEAFNILKDTAVDLGPSGWDQEFGHGRIDAGAAALAASGGSFSPPPSGVLDIRVSTSSNDAEQQIGTGSMDLTSTDIEVGDDPGFNEDQLAGLRFTNVNVPQGATITNAYIEFTVDETDTVATSVTIKAHDTDDASPFTTLSNNISSRTATSASVAWNNISSWTTVGVTQQSPDISSVIQEVVDRNGWTNGNDIAIIIDGSGSRTSESYDGSSTSAPLLHIEYDVSAAPPPPPSDTPENFKVAFLGDQGLNSSSEAVLSLINSENVGMVLHLGDFDYADNPTAWDNQINTFLPGVPYFGAIGNHDVAAWGGADGYQSKLQNRLNNIPGAVCTGDLGVKSSCHYQGLFFILSGVGTMGSGHETYIQNELAADDSIWSICAWHKNQQAMQVGGKTNEVGWGAYEACREGGAIIATAHEHSYERTKTLTSTQNQVVDPAWSDPGNLRVAEGSTFAFVSGLGGQSIRDQERCTPYDYPYGCSGEWASVYTSNQGATDGALFCEFNHNGVANKAFCYFKNTSGQTIDTFNVTSQIGIEIPQEPPVVYDQSVSTFEDIALDITLVASDANNDPLTYSTVSGPSSGSLSGTGQTRTYTPNPGFSGNDYFTFKANDGIADSNIATVSITVDAIPISGTLNIRVISGNDDAEQRLDTNAVNIASTDLELTEDVANQIVGMRFQGVIVPQGATITSAYVQFEEDTADSVSTSVTIRAQDSDDADTFSSSTNNISNRPTTSASVAWNNIPAWGASSAKHNTPDISSVIQEVVDRSGWTPGNDMAIIIDGTGSRTAEAYEGESANAPLLHIEYDASLPQKLLTINGDPLAHPEQTTNNYQVIVSGQIQLGPNANSGDSISTDGTTANGGIWPTGTDDYYFTGDVISITADHHLFTYVDGVEIPNDSPPAPTPNNPPVADNQSISTDEDTQLAITLSATDADGDPLTYTVLTNVTNGVLTGTAPNLTYTPNSGFYGNDSFDFKANDGADDSNTATISITVNQVNDIPIALADNYSTQEDTVLNVASPGVLGNDTDSDPLSTVLDSDVTNGSLNLNADGSFSYTPNQNFNGVDSFTYHANDGWVDSNTVTVTIDVGPVNDAPTADAGGPYSGIEGQSISFVGDNSSDPDGDDLSYSWDFGDGGTSTQANPTHTYSSDGIFSVSLTVTDGDANDTSSTTATVSAIQAVHVGDLDISKTGNKNWHARVLVTVHDGNDFLTPNITVTGDWYDDSGSKINSASCITESGTCEVSQQTRGSMLTFMIIGLSGSGYQYDAASNHDPDGDSDSNEISITKDGQSPGVNVAPEFTSNPIDGQSIGNGEQYSGDISDDATDSNGDTLTFAKVSGPGWLNVASDGTLGGIATMVTSLPETQEFVVRVSDPDGLEDTATLQIQITEPAPVTQIHIGSIDGIGEPGKGQRWSATVNILVHNATHAPVSGVIVSGDWSDDASGSDSCVTDDSGVCSVSKNIRGGAQATFTVNDLTGTNVQYVPDDNEGVNLFTVSRP